jgi:hypothetical protein
MGRFHSFSMADVKLPKGTVHRGCRGTTRFDLPAMAKKTASLNHRLMCHFFDIQIETSIKTIPICTFL